MISQSMSLAHALNHISHVLGIQTPADVIPYADLDPHGGYHADYNDGFPSGSMWRVEGQFLYALIRALKPRKVLELGTWHGCSATHILQALEDNNHGYLECVDNSAYGSVVVGDMIPDELRHRVKIYQSSLEVAVSIEPDDAYDLIFEDAMHETPQVAFVWSHMEKLLNPGGVMISHDAMHRVAGFAVREGIAQAGYSCADGYGNSAACILIAPADCGFAIWRKRFE